MGYSDHKLTLFNLLNIKCYHQHEKVQSSIVGVNMRRRHQLSNMTDMFMSVANGNLEGLKNYLKNGGNVNLKDGNGTTLLHKASGDGDVDKVKVLLENGCSLDPIDTDDCTPVYIAVSKRNHSVLKILLESGALANLVSNQLMTPLMLAVIMKDCASVRILLEFGKDCDIDMENLDRKSALTQAIVSNNLEICRILLSQGASVKCIYGKSFSIELARVLCQNIELMKIFLKFAKRMDLYYHLVIACLYKKPDVAEMILMEYENPFQLKALGFILKQEEDGVWERLSKFIIRSYKFATKCSTDNKFLLLLLSMCAPETVQEQKRNHKYRAKSMIRILVKYGLVIHPHTLIISCDSECECRKCVFTALYDHDSVTTLKGQCCSVIRQTLKGEIYFKSSDVSKLPIPKSLKKFISMEDC